MEFTDFEVLERESNVFRTGQVKYWSNLKWIQAEMAMISKSAEPSMY